MKKEQIKDWIILVAKLVLLAMAALPILGIMHEWMRYIYATAAVIILLVQATIRYKGKDLRLKRLFNMNVIAAGLYCASAFCTFYSEGTQDWVAFLMSGAILNLYATFMIERRNKKSA